jgi:hypothetical protein
MRCCYSPSLLLLYSSCRPFKSFLNWLPAFSTYIIRENEFRTLKISNCRRRTREHTYKVTATSHEPPSCIQAISILNRQLVTTNPSGKRALQRPETSSAANTNLLPSKCPPRPRSSAQSLAGLSTAALLLNNLLLLSSLPPTQTTHPPAHTRS